MLSFFRSKSHTSLSTLEMAWPLAKFKFEPPVWPCKLPLGVPGTTLEGQSA